MTMTVRQLNRFCLLALAPFIGIALWMLLSGMSITLPSSAYPAWPKMDTAADPSAPVSAGLERAAKTASYTAASIKKVAVLYNKTNASMNAVVTAAKAQAGRPEQIYNRRITLKLGAPSGVIQSDKLRAELYYIKAQHFHGYALKVKLKSPKAMKMVLGNDKNGGAETTLSAVNRYHAAAGVNAGGFADSGGGRYPLSTTVVNGQYLNGFQPSFKDLFFVGMSQDMTLIGGNYSKQAQLDDENPRFGASFVPILLQNGVMQPIPAQWQASPGRAPRTVIADYKDNQLLFLVTDGSESRATGASLDELQILLKRFGAVDAYNLDGGGSSSLVFNGRVVNHPSDGQLRKVATNFLFFK